MAKKLDFTIGRLLDITKSYVEKAKRYCGPDASFYEPPLDQSHLWSKLEGVVEHAEDTLEDIRLETEGGEELYRAILKQMTEGEP